MMNTYSPVDQILMAQYGINPTITLEMLRLAPAVPKTQDEALLLTNLYQVHSTISKLAAAQQELLNLQVNSTLGTLPLQPLITPTYASISSSLPSSPASMSPTRVESLSPQPVNCTGHINFQFPSNIPPLQLPPIPNTYFPQKPAYDTTYSSNTQPLKKLKRKRKAERSVEVTKRVKYSYQPIVSDLPPVSQTAKPSTTIGTPAQESTKKTFLDLYEAYGVIGVGGGGMVYAGRRITDKLPVAIKRVMRDKVKRWEKVQGHTVPQEIALMLR